MMDWQNAAIGLLSVGSGVFGWVLKTIVADQKELEKQLALFRAEVPRDYVSKTDDARRWHELFTVLQRIEEKLDHKADKP